MTEQALTVVENRQANIVNVEEFAMSVDGLLKQVDLIQKVMHGVMKEDEHYGTIPGTKKPSLYKPGAEKLCLTFRLDPEYEIIREVREKDFIAYTVKCVLVHIPSVQRIANGIGSCNTRETKYRWRFIDELSDKPVPSTYWDARKANNNKEMKRLLGGDGFRAAKNEETGKWVIARSQKVENDNPWDLDNTIIKMACKRALVAATLNATAASDIFSQDLEDLPPGVIRGSNGAKAKPVETIKPPPKFEPAKPADSNGRPLNATQIGKIVHMAQQLESPIGALDIQAMIDGYCAEHGGETYENGKHILDNFHEVLNNHIDRQTGDVAPQDEDDDIPF
ncbi:MAG: hypothetical protein HQ561_04335 [Desulfobacteraceae bacterium]|nr:hypothetical protein [Desulfobacteraceae bacterium]